MRREAVSRTHISQNVGLSTVQDSATEACRQDLQLGSIIKGVATIDVYEHAGGCSFAIIRTGP